MVLTRPELLAALQNEVRILRHLTTKIDRSKLDYRPTEHQRSTLELLRYLTVMGPQLVLAAKAGAFDGEAWSAAEEASRAMSFDEVLASLAAQPETYASMLADVTDQQMREEVEIFGEKTSRGAFLVNMVLCGCAAYRTQVFLYLKSCGRSELSTWDLWVGIDAPAEPQA